MSHKIQENAFIPLPTHVPWFNVGRKSDQVRMTAQVENSKKEKLNKTDFQIRVAAIPAQHEAATSHIISNCLKHVPK